MEKSDDQLKYFLDILGNVLKRDYIRPDLLRCVAEIYKRMYDMVNEENKTLKKQNEFLENIITSSDDNGFKVNASALAANFDSSEKELLIAEKNKAIVEIHKITRIKLINKGFNYHKTYLAKNNANKRHKENRESKEMVFNWLDLNYNKYSSMDKAASAVSGKIVPMSWRTVRAWIGEWKKIRSASRT